jgi:hypothetical protein
MGVYIFQSLYAPYIKIGHYQGKNAFSRIAHRGFYSCSCPREISQQVSMQDLMLIAWFPHQTRKTEQVIKKKWKSFRYKKSEWMPLDKLQEILSFLETLEPNQAHQCDPFEALLTRRRL